MTGTASRWTRSLVDCCAAAVAGALLLVLSDLLVPPAAAPFPGHGESFAAMARAPLAADAAFPQRILWPLGAWLAGCVGVTPVGFAQLCNGALLATAFWFARRRGAALVDAALVAAALATSGAVQVYKPMTCLSDPLNLLLLVLLVHFAGRPAAFWPLVLASALSHELVFFLLPWLVFLRASNGGSLRADLPWSVACLAAYAGFRLALRWSGVVGAYDVGYYLEHAFWMPLGLPAIWALWAFVVLVEFGPLLAAAVFAAHRGALARASGMGGPGWAWLYVPGVLALMLLAYDVMRFATLVFLPVLLGCLELLRVRGGRWILAALVAASAIVYALLHPVPSEQGGRHFTIIAGEILARIGLLASRSWDDAVHFHAALLQRFWPWALAALLAAGAIAALGARLARLAPGAALERALR